MPETRWLAENLLTEHREKLEALARALLQAESLSEHQIRKVAGLEVPPAWQGDITHR